MDTVFTHPAKKLTDCREAHETKAELPMVNTPEGTVIVVSPEELKAELPIEVSAEASPNVTIFRLGLYANTLLSIWVTMSGTAKARRAPHFWNA